MQNGDVIERPPRTIMEVYKMLPEGTLAELIEGIIYMSPSPIRKHQELLGELFTSILTICRKGKIGKVFIAPFDVYLDENSNAVQPDIIFVSKENQKIIQDHIHGVPDLLIELLSPGNSTHDTVTKKNLYEKFGVKEYWIIDPETFLAIGYQLQNEKYVEIGNSIGSMNSLLLNQTFYFKADPSVSDKF
jgi:Uma2 family endonuclease